MLLCENSGKQDVVSLFDTRYLIRFYFCSNARNRNNPLKKERKKKDHNENELCSINNDPGETCKSRSVPNFGDAKRPKLATRKTIEKTPDIVCLCKPDLWLQPDWYAILRPNTEFTWT